MILAAAGAALSLPAIAQFAKPEDAIKYRQSAMFMQGYHMSRLGAMSSGRAPYDAASATSNAEMVAQISKLPWIGFGAGMEGGKAKPEIWKEQPKFGELSDKLVSETGKLLVASKAGNLDALKTAVSAVGETCKSCHDTFRSK
ncbi:Cytochrome c' [Variovorax sp. PBL-H6]|nr:Cytochrome c' [Variovorax sp. PBL-H6]